MRCPTYIVCDNNTIGPCTVRKIYASGLLGGEGSGVWPLAGCHFLLSASCEKCQICQELFFSFCSTLFPLLNTVKMLRTLLSFFKINHCTNADHSISWIKPSIAKPRNHMGETANAVFFKMYPAPSLTSCSPILSCPLEKRPPRWLGWSPSSGWTKIISS